jgi:predicted nucleic acid-binding protein
MKLVVDNTVMSNFALVNRVDLLRLIADEAITTVTAWDELQSGVALGRIAALNWSWLEIVTLQEAEDKLARTWRSALGLGEATCMAVAYAREFRFATDDRLARREARRLGIPITGTLGLLRALVDDQAITLDEGNLLLQQMIRYGYRCPVQSL